MDACLGSATDLCKDAKCTDYGVTLHRHYSALINLITGESLHMDIHRMQNQHNDNKRYKVILTGPRRTVSLMPTDRLL